MMSLALCWMAFQMMNYDRLHRRNHRQGHYPVHRQSRHHSAAANLAVAEVSVHPLEEVVEHRRWYLVGNVLIFRLSHCLLTDH
jgi:hypothetical protein